MSSNNNGGGQANDASQIPVPLFDMQRQTAALESDIAAAVLRVCASGHFIMGPDCEKLEQELATCSHVPHGIACASGSDALLLALMAFDIGPGDEVLLPSYTFFATASAVWRLGAKPVFVDIEPAHYNLDPRLIAPAITHRTKAIIPVHLYGQCADMTAINEIAKRHKLAVIEDAAQAIGAEHRGRRAGSLSDVGCLSFYPTKNLGGFGDGGLLLTLRDDIAEKLKLLRAHGMQPRYYHKVVGINSRLDSLQAAVLRVKLPHLDRWTAQRAVNATRYHEMFAACGLDNVLTLPVAAAGNRHVWNQFVVRVPDGRRDALREHLKQQRIGTEIYYPVPLHQQECFASLGYAVGSLPESERAAQETLALPIFPELSTSEQTAVVREIAAFYGIATSKNSQVLAGPKYLSATARRQDA